MKNISRRVLGFTVVILAIGVGVFVYFGVFSGDEAVVPTVSPSSSPLSGTRTFTSPELGISFKYAAEQSYGAPTKVTQVGNRVYVSVGDASVESGQFVEIFTKPAQETLTDAMKRQILSNFPSPDCQIKSAPSNIQGGYLVAEIDYPMDPEADGPYWENAKLCNEKYAKANGIRYFLYDPAHPTRFAFVDIGQYFIQGVGDTPWQHFIVFLD